MLGNITLSELVGRVWMEGADPVLVGAAAVTGMLMTTSARLMPISITCALVLIAAIVRLC